MIKWTFITLICSIAITNCIDNRLIREAINASDLDRACLLTSSRALLENSPASVSDFFGPIDAITSAVLLKRAQFFGGSLGQVYIIDMQPNCTGASIRGTVADSLTDADIKHIFTANNMAFKFAPDMLIFAAPGEKPALADILPCISPFLPEMASWDGQSETNDCALVPEDFADRFLNLDALDSIES